MAFVTRYSFTWLDEVENVRRIIIDQDGGTPRSPSYKGHSLGGAPVLSRAKNDNVLSTSLSFPAEVKLDGDFRETFTSNPFEFRVRLLTGNTTIWQGWLATETYQEDEKPVPYDVRLTAIDGLARLKDDPYEPAESVETLGDILKYILADTATQTIYTSTTIRTTNSTPSDFLDRDVNLGNFTEDGESKYEVLQAILRSMNALICLNYHEDLGMFWYIFRETDLTSLYDDEFDFIRLSNLDEEQYGDEVGVAPGVLGEMGEADMWPIGYMTRKVEAAKKATIVSSENHYRSALENSALSSGSTGWYRFSGDTMLTPSGNLSWNSADHIRLPAGYGAAQAIELYYSDPSVLRLTVECWGHSSQIDRPNKVTIKVWSYDPTDPSQISKWRYRLTDEDKNGAWSGGDTYPYQTIQYGDGTINDKTTVELSFPNPGANRMLVVGVQGSVSAETSVYSVRLDADTQFDGVRETCKINNNALYDDSEVGVCFTPYVLPGFVPYVYGQISASEQLWRSDKLPNSSYMEFIAKDYALSRGLPRLRRSGTLNCSALLPPVFVKQDVSGDLYVVESCDYDLLHAELKADLMSVPVATSAILTSLTRKQIESLSKDQMRSITKRLHYLERMIRR